MACLSLGFLFHLAIVIVVVCGIIAMIRLLLPMIAGTIFPPVVIGIINIVLWVTVAIIVLYFLFVLFGCLLSVPGRL